MATQSPYAGYTTPTSPAPLSTPTNVTETVEETRYTGYGQPYTVRVPKVSTTTLSNENKINQVPGMVNDLNNLSNKGISTNAQGTPQYADGSIAKTVQSNVYNADGSTDITYSDGTTEHRAAQQQSFLPGSANEQQQQQGFIGADTSAEDKAYQDILDQMRSSLDATTKASIDNIQQKFAQREAEQKEINRRQVAGERSALLMGGLTGKGSASQFTPLSSGGIISAQESYGIKQLSALDAQENDAIASAKAAQQAGNFQLMEKQLSRIEEKRKEKIALAEKLNEQIAKRNEKIQEQNLQAQRESAITDLYLSGATDVTSIVKALKEQGIQISSKEIAETLKNLVPPGLDDLVKTLRQNGAPQDVIQNVLSSQDINSAYKNAGSWGAGGTGIIAEYNLYKAQAEAAGQVPVDFNTYQNIDTNRKIKVAAAGVANQYGLDKEQRARVYSLMDDYDKQTKDIKTVMSSSRQIDALSKLALSSNTDKGSRAASQIGTIFSFMKMLDPTSTVREGEYATAQNTAGVSDQVRNRYNKVLNGSFLTDGQINGYVTTAKALATSRERNLQEIDKEFDRRGELSGIPAGTISKTVGTTTNESLVQTEENAKQKVTSYGNTNPKFRPIILKKVNETNPFTGQKYTYQELLEIYPEIK